MTLNKTLLAALVAASCATLGTSAAQAARLSLLSGSVGGSLLVDASVNGAPVTASAGVDDLSGAGFLLGAGDNDFSQPLTPSGTLNHLWSASVSLDTTLDPASASFSAGTASVLFADANGLFDVAQDSSSVLLQAELSIDSTGEAAGTAVRLEVAGEADSLFGSTGPGVEGVPTFDLLVRDADSNILGSWQGLAAGGTESFSFSFTSQVGQQLSFSLSLDNSLMAGIGQTLDHTALLSGSISVSAVPEPETYALFLAGLAAVGLLQRRRRSAA